jgi:hypothetical protein
MLLEGSLSRLGKQQSLMANKNNVDGRPHYLLRKSTFATNLIRKK